MSAFKGRLGKCPQNATNTYLFTLIIGGNKASRYESPVLIMRQFGGVHLHSPWSEFEGNVFVRQGRCSCIWTRDYSFHQAGAASYTLFKSESSLSERGQPNAPAMSWFGVWPHFILCSVFEENLSRIPLSSHVKSV